MRLTLFCVAAACVVLAPGCGKKDSPEKTDQPPASAGHGAAAGGGGGASGKGKPAKEPRAMPKMPPLTEETARKVLHDALDRLGGDDLSRQALLYMADLGDRAAVDAVKKELLADLASRPDGDVDAGVAYETLLAFGERDAAGKAIALAKKLVPDDDVNEFVVHALARIDGPERAEATALLVKIAQGEDVDQAWVALEALAQAKAPEARAAFAKIAADDEADARLRATAVVGLLHLGDSQGKELAEKLVAAVFRGDAKDKNALAADEVLDGFAVEGAVEGVPYVKTILDRVITEESVAMIEAPSAVKALATIYRGGGGRELEPFLRELAKREDGDYASEAALALFAIGDDASAAQVADDLRGFVTYFESRDQEPSVEILDIVARRGAATRPEFREIVDTAAQVKAPASMPPGTEGRVFALNAAAAHAFLKSK